MEITHPQLRDAATRWQLSSSLQWLIFSSKLEPTVHDVFTEDGIETVCASCLGKRPRLPQRPIAKKLMYTIYFVCNSLSGYNYVSKDRQ